MPKIKTVKNTLLKKALEVFYKQGYYATTFSDLSLVCGIEKPHFYYYFNSRKALMEEVLLYAHAIINKFILAKAYNENYMPKERLNMMVENMLKLYVQYYLGCIMGNTVLETSGTADEFTSILRHYFDDWKNALSYVHTSNYNKDEARTMAIQDIQQLQGSMIFMKLYDDKNYLFKAV